MPQMMPINWLLMYFFFICIFLLFIIMNYFIFYYKINLKKKNKSFKMNFFNWKW